MTDTGRPLDEGWIDISVPLRPGIAIFEGDPTFHLARAFSIEGGAVCNVSRVDMGVHTGNPSRRPGPLHRRRPGERVDPARGRDGAGLGRRRDGRRRAR